MRAGTMEDTRGKDDYPLDNKKQLQSEEKGPWWQGSQCQDELGDDAETDQLTTDTPASSAQRDVGPNFKRPTLLQGNKGDKGDQEIMDFHTLDLIKDDTTDITSEFLTLPSKLSGRSSPSVLHRLHHFLSPDSKLGHHSRLRQRSNSDSRLGNHSGSSPRLEHRYSYDSRLDFYSSHGTSWMFGDCSKKSLNPSSNTKMDKSAENLPKISSVDFPKTEFSDISIPKMGFSDVSIVIDNLDQEDMNVDELTSNVSDILTGNNHEDEDPTLGAQGVWIGLETKNKVLLSPRSSNGSICSFRSSNADSAIEMLTPEEEMCDMHDFANQQESWESDLIGSKSEKPSFSSQDFKLEKSELSEVWRQVMFNKSKSSQSKVCNEQSQILEPIPTFESSDQKQVVQSPPSVIVSDYSTSTHEDKGSQTEGDDSLQDQLDIMDKRFLSFTRSQSNSSISSTDTSLSIQSDSSQDVDDPQEQRICTQMKQSSWKKIRNIVHWSPFIQQFKRRRYPWIQLAGHQGNFHAGEQPGAILKKFDSSECKSFHKLMSDVLRPYVPEFRGEASKDGERCIQLQDLLCEFETPCVMDIKMGCRTYLEEELTKAREKPSLRKDMYQKMVEVDPSAPTPEENAQKAITKPRYMQWRDEMSSSVELGFRIEGIRKSDGANIKNFKTTKQKSCIKEILRQFVSDNNSVMNMYLRRLKSIQATQEVSPFFKSHEIIGSSLLFVHDKNGQASIWMIDFGKTAPLPETVSVDHRSKWEEGNHEDGYLCGVTSLIEMFEDLVQEKHESSKMGSNSNSVSNSSNETNNANTSSNVTESEHKDSERDSERDKDGNQQGQNDNTSKEPRCDDSLKESRR